MLPVLVTFVEPDVNVRVSEVVVLALVLVVRGSAVESFQTPNADAHQTQILDLLRLY